MNASPLLIQNIRLSSEDGVSRIAADVDGRTVWYESSDVEMQRRGEIFACAFLLPAMKSGRGLRIEGVSISPLWLANAKRLMKIFSEWWGYTTVEISCDSACPVVETIAAPHTGLFFTGGVDSFYSLLFPKEQIDDLVYVHGFDVGVNDQKRFEDTRLHLAQVATDTGRRLILLKTNLREHPLIREIDWTKAHGGALASAGYTLPGIGRMIISASDSGRLIVPMGTHPETDPLWSNNQLVLVHQGTEASRIAKLEVIADHPLVMRHLRVCWKNVGRTSNCCRCEKCIRTMLILDSLGKLTSFEAFPSRRGLFWRACQISSITPSSMRGYRSRLVTCPRWQTRLAMRIMMSRSWLRNQKKAILKRLIE